ncbi:hypothetical protein GGE07_005978 [Sinorhizobium terangae]|uniref:Uncharacterized protein n=1 Tax=Sinorhizobium terangae TaxID=110322 RepID=A0A6N7LK02_SINTE|nr:hypothetical protein [Sinorhizobium terangae]MBB4189296.1 hypothetical protein [Sinorhizobium terangae]MQX18191.1 hypothetical protein [Sinorhizobium terangae]
MFAEPNVKRDDGGDLLNVAWFGSYDDDPKELGAIDRAKLSRVEEDLIQRLEALKPALRDPEIGETVAAMLNVYDDKFVMAVGEHAVLTNWGALPSAATVSEAAYARHIDGTISRFLKTDMMARLPGKQWASLGSIEAKDPSHVKRTNQPIRRQAPAMTPPPAVTVAGVQRPVRWWVPAALVALFGAILVYTAWPGNLIYEKESPADQGVLSQLATENENLAQNITLLKSEIGKNACAIDPTLVGLPPREAVSTTPNPAAGQQGGAQ